MGDVELLTKLCWHLIKLHWARAPRGWWQLQTRSSDSPGGPGAPGALEQS
jgi:hypothetical protein